jgi:hypothetical protein
MIPKTIENKLVEHRVILDMSPVCCAFTGVPQYVELDLHKDGKWFCTYMGFLDSRQVEELRATYEVRQRPLDSPEFLAVNERLRCAARSPEALKKLLETLNVEIR